MNPKLKIVIYAILVIGAIVFGVLFYSSYKNATLTSEPVESVPTNIESEITSTPDAASNEIGQTRQPVQANRETNFGSVATNAGRPELATTQSAVPSASKPAHGRS
jgi:hypothetical protein